MAVTQDFNWITQRYPELQRKYPSRYIAVKNGKVVASGRDFGKVYDAAVRRVKKDFVTHSLRGTLCPRHSPTTSPLHSLEERSPNLSDELMVLTSGGLQRLCFLQDQHWLDESHHHDIRHGRSGFSPSGQVPEDLRSRKFCSCQTLRNLTCNRG